MLGLYMVNKSSSAAVFVGPVRVTLVCASFNFNNSSSAAVLTASSDRLGPHGL